MFYIILGSLNYYFMFILDAIAILSMARSKSCYRKATVLQFQFYFLWRISLLSVPVILYNVNNEASMLASIYIYPF